MRRVLTGNKQVGQKTVHNTFFPFSLSIYLPVCIFFIIPFNQKYNGHIKQSSNVINNSKTKQGERERYFVYECILVSGNNSKMG